MKALQVALLFLCLAFPVKAGVSTNAAAHKPPLQIVVLRKGVDMEGLMQQHGLSPKHRYRKFNSFAAPMPEADIQKLKADPRVMFVEADGPVQLCGQTNGFGLVRMGFDQFPMSHINGTPQSLDVDVAVLDSGIDPHTDLPPSYDWFSPFSDNPNDELNHGTAVAGVIAATDNGYGVVGVAPGVRIWNIKCIGPPPQNSWGNIISGMEYVAEHADQISVANMSIVNDGLSPHNTIHYFLQQMVEAGIVFVAPVGNGAQDMAGPDGFYGAQGNASDDVMPASDPYAMAVSAMDPRTDTFWEDSPTLGSNFSQVERTNGYATGRTNHVFSPGGAIDVAAPGVHIATTAGNGTNAPATWGTSYSLATGTSMAAPHVAGLVALYIAAHGRATNAAGVFAIRQAIINASLPQAQWRPHGYPFDSVTNNTGDPDTRPEPLAIASEDWVPKPLITSTAGAPGNYSVQFGTVPGYDYTVQSTTNLTPPIQWTNVATRTGSNFLATVSITDSNLTSQNFYRLARKGLTGPPLIIVQLQSLKLPLGETGTFSLTVGGVAPFGYRWQKGATPLPDEGTVTGASAVALTLTLTNVQVADAGEYSVVVTNAYGSVTSAVATLTVLTNWTTNTVTGVLATATSQTPPGNLASSAVNGLLNHPWQSTAADLDPAIKFDLGAVRALDALQIWSGPQSGVGVTQMHIETSDDGISFNSLGNFTLTTLSPASETISLGGVATRYVRLGWLRNSSGQFPPGSVMIDEVVFREYLGN